MCAINRVSSEPPCHYECAQYSARACPFLANPQMIRRRARAERETGQVAEGAVNPAGTMIQRNPGLALLWVTRYNSGWHPERDPADPHGGAVVRIGPPKAVEWWARGRAATRAEVLHSIDTGLPLLQEMAERDGPAAVAELDRMREVAMALVPAA
jgi:hypothetical protein